MTIQIRSSARAPSSEKTIPVQSPAVMIASSSHMRRPVSCRPTV